MAKHSTKDDSQEPLIEELMTLAREVDVDGLKFLIEQANVLIYNQKVEELNMAAKRVSDVRESSGQQKDAPHKDESSPGVHVEKGAFGQSYILVVGAERKIMDEDEIYRLVTIAHDTDDEEEGAVRLYRWLERNRDDIIVNCGMKPNGRSTRELYRYMREHFQIRRDG
jgi:hypothetical protein